MNLDEALRMRLRIPKENCSSCTLESRRVLLCEILEAGAREAIAAWMW